MDMKNITARVMVALVVTLVGGAMLGGGATMAVAQTTPQGQQAPQGQGAEPNEAKEENEPSSPPLTGQTYQKAVQATLAETGGKVLETHAGEEPGVAYDVDVALPGGGEADVHLDSNFNVIEVLDDSVPDNQQQALPDTAGFGILPVVGLAGGAGAMLLAGGLLARRVMR